MGTVRIAEETIRRIDGMIERDQGSSFRHFLGKVMPHMTDAFRTEDDGHRTHLGASLIGGECARAIWYGFRWATKPKFPGRVLRLFNRGHLEEARFIAMFLMIGCEVYQQDAEGKQFRITHAGGHFGGSGDGVVINLPELQAGLAALLEFKTHGEKSFTELAGKSWRKHYEHILDPSKPKVAFDGKGVRNAKFEHYVQMQTYMRKMGLTVALYGAVNKNTDDIYLELVTLDPIVGDQFLDRGTKIIFANIAPTKISQSPGFFGCMWCDHKPVCHLRAVPDVNCRTCVNSKPLEDGTWLCVKYDYVIPKETQLTGCQEYSRNPEI
jgi:hypothetical protein